MRGHQLAAEVHEGFAALRHEQRPQLRARRHRRHQRRGGRRDLRLDDLLRLLGGAFAERHVALDAGEPRAVLGDVEQMRLDLASGRRRGRALAPRRQRLWTRPVHSAAGRRTAPRRSPRRRSPARRSPARGGGHVTAPLAAAAASVEHVAKPDDRVEHGLHERVLELGAGQLPFLFRVRQIPISIITAGMFADSSTRSGARSTGRAASGMRSRNCACEQHRQIAAIDRGARSARDPTARDRFRAIRRRTSARARIRQARAACSASRSNARRRSPRRRARCGTRRWRAG